MSKKLVYIEINDILQLTVTWAKIPTEDELPHIERRCLYEMFCFKTIVSRVLVKSTLTSNIEIFDQCCQYFFHVELPSVQLRKRF